MMDKKATFRYVIVSGKPGLYNQVCDALKKEKPGSSYRRAETLREGVNILAEEGQGILLADLAEAGFFDKKSKPGTGRESAVFYPDCFTPERGKAKEDVGYVKYYIRMHLDEDLSLKTLAKKMNISPNYLCTMFREQEKISISDFIEKNRIEKAAYLLETEDSRTQDISKRVGYHYPSYFSRVFRQYYGFTPTRYRKMKRKGAEGTAT